nr:hypothetical protein [Tanacetum cinerariifolium]GEV61994.1 hypothetical protein [Tanacetum cinerariifolium]
MKDTLSSCSDLVEQEIQQLQKQAKILKENSLNKLNALQTTIQHLLSSNYSMYCEFRDGFHRLFKADERTFKSVLSRNMHNLERKLNKETLHEKDSNSDLKIQNKLKRLNERNLQIQKCKVQKVKATNASLGDTNRIGIVSDKGNNQSLKNQSNTSRNESSRSRNERNDKSTSGDDTDIRPSYDTEPMVEVPYTVEDNVFAIENQHSEQPESINDTHVMEKDDRNVIPDSPNMCDNDNQADKNAEACDDERVALANLIGNLKRNFDENNKIQKQLKKENASLTQEMKECKSTLETELEKYKAFNDCTIDYDILEHKNIAISELKKLIEMIKGKGVDANFEKQSILGKLPLQPIRNKPVVGLKWIPIRIPVETRYNTNNSASPLGNKTHNPKYIICANYSSLSIVLEKDLEISKRKKEKYKSLALKARNVLSEEEASSSDSKDEEYAMAKIKEDNKEKENHSDSEDDSKKEEICLMTLDNNEVLSDTPYYSSSSIDNESWKNDQMHNNIMAAGSRDCLPMLATGRYAQWQSCFLRYIDTRPNSDALRKCILKAVETIMNMSPENKAHYESEKEAIHLLLTRIGDEIYSTVDAFSYHKLFDVLKQYQKKVNEIHAERIAKNANPLALVTAAQPYQNPYYQPLKPYRSYVPPSKQSSSTRSNATTKYKGKEIAKPITPPPESASEEDNNPEQAHKDKDMQKNLALIAKNQRTVTVAGAKETVGSQVVQQTRIQCFNCKEFSHFTKECKNPKRVKDYSYHKEKMLCKQAEKGVPLQAEQADWLADTDKEIDEQELEAHYSYIEKIQEHAEQPESISNTCVVEKVDSNVIPDSPDMCDNDIQVDQNAIECDDEHVVLANLIKNLKLNVDEIKKIQKQLKKANISLAHELKKYKSIIVEASRTIGESNSIWDSCLISLQNKQTEL